MPEALRRMTRERAGERCEYCRLPQIVSVLSFHIEHIIPRQHGGETRAVMPSLQFAEGAESDGH